MPVIAPVTVPPDLLSGPAVLAFQAASCAIMARMASLIPPAGHPSAMLMPAMSELLAGALSHSLTAFFGMGSLPMEEAAADGAIAAWNGSRPPRGGAPQTRRRARVTSRCMGGA